MARWEPNARERLQSAAMQLFVERGYDRTTVADIAARADLTERTFFRYFADKREVLFAGAQLEALLLDGIAQAPPATGPLAAVAAALEGLDALFAERRASARKRQALIEAHPELLERELVKLARLGTAIAGGLRERGVAAARARLVAETGITLFRLAFERWLDDARKRSLAQHIRAALADLRQVTAEARPSRRR